MLDAVSKAVATNEVNAAMGTICATPTAGSAGVVPGTLFAVKEKLHPTKEQMVRQLTKEKNVSISEIMITQEIEVTGRTREDIFKQMEANLAVMEDAVQKGIEGVVSHSGLTGGDAVKLQAINIGHMEVARKDVGQEALMTIEVDQTIDPAVFDELRALPNIIEVTQIAD
ncbi:hypothetical protein DT075_24725 [Bacillus licheniformis]|nr:hypothetical protein DT075_24725 [Bacillus licheniformis]